MATMAFATFAFIGTMVLTLILFLMSYVDTALLVCYIGLSLTTLAVVLTRYTPLKSWNGDLYKIMRFSSKSKVLTTKGKKISNAKEAAIVDFIDDTYKSKKGFSLDPEDMKKMGIIASLGFVTTPVYANKVVRYCCKEVPAKIGDMLKIDKHIGHFEYAKVDRLPYNVVNQSADYYIGDKYLCTHDPSCNNVYYITMLSFSRFFVGMILFAITARILWYISHIFKEPVASSTVETTVGKDKFIKIKNKYFSWFRLMHVGCYIICFATTILFLVKCLGAIPTTTAELIPIEKVLVKNGVTMKCFVESEKNYVICKSNNDFSSRIKRGIIDDFIIPESLDCEIDPVEYVLSGSTIGKCTYSSKLQGTMIKFTKNKPIERDIDQRCFSISNIMSARVGRSACVKECKLRNNKSQNCKVVFNPNNELIVKQTKPIEKLEYDLTGFDITEYVPLVDRLRSYVAQGKVVENNETNTGISKEKEPKEISDEKVVELPAVESTGQSPNDSVVVSKIGPEEEEKNNKTVDSTHSRRKRNVGNTENLITTYGEGTYVLPDGFVTQFLTAEEYGGSVLTAELDPGVPCLERSSAVATAVCSHGRRQIISCEPDLVARSNSPSNVFECMKPKHPNLLPEWRKTRPVYNFKYEEDEQLAGEFEIPDFSTTIFDQTMMAKPVTADIKVLYARRDQDTRQQVGNLKYFVYSFMLSVKAPKDFYHMVFQNAIQMSQVNNTKEDYYMYRFDHETRRDTLLKAFDKYLSIEWQAPPSQRNMRQDKSNVNYVIKVDVFDVDGKNMEDKRDCISDRDGNCEFLVPLYYAFRLYGPMKAKIKIYNHPIENIYVMSDVCSSVNAIKLDNICYFPDFNYVSTDVIASGYPMTKNSIVAFSKMLDYSEMPSFYTNHPKIGSGQYMAKVSSSANLGYYTTKGKCLNVNISPLDGLVRCNGLIGTNINIVKYTTFHRPLSSDPNCKLMNNTIHCKYKDKAKITKCAYNLGNDKEYKTPSCTMMTTDQFNHTLDEHSSVTYHSSNMIMQLHRGQSECKNCLLIYFRESYYRCAWGMILVALVAGCGFVMLFMHLILLIAGLFNSYNLGRLARMLGLTCLVTGYAETPKCGYCNMYMYSIVEEKKHEASCHKNNCPYCILWDTSKNLIQVSFSSRTNFLRHMSLHKSIRINPYNAMFKILRGKVVLYTLVFLTIPRDMSAITFDHPSGLRNSEVGTNVTLPNDVLSCTVEQCGIAHSYRANIPLSHGSSIVVESLVDNVKFANKIVIKNPRLSTVCSYAYTAATGSVGSRHIAYACHGKSNCGFSHSDYFNPIPGHTGDAFIPFDVVNPLKGGFCPMSKACLSPIVDVFWVSAGCATINDGIAMGVEYYTPDVVGDMMHVFECSITSIDYEHCDNLGCNSVSGEKSLIDDGNIVFDHVNQQLPTSFIVGALSKQGDTLPKHVFVDLPRANENSDDYLSYRMNKIPTGETCLDGTTFTSASCDISTSGSSPSLNCKSKIPKIELQTAVKRYHSLVEKYHCNIDEASLKWTTNVLERSLVVGGKEHKDTQTYSWPSLDLNLQHCSLGFASIDLVSMRELKLEQVKYTGKVNKVECVGLYNRNHMTQLRFKLEGSDGLFEFHCPRVFSEVCLFDSNKYSTCNVTTMLPFNNTCEYMGQSINVDCTKLMYSEPDPSSSTHGFITGSTEINTWVSGFSLFLSSWWGLSMMIAGSILLIGLIIWIIMACSFAAKSAKIAGGFSKPLNLAADTEPLMIDYDNYNNHYRTETRKRNTRSYKPFTASL